MYEILKIIYNLKIKFEFINKKINGQIKERLSIRLKISQFLGYSEIYCMNNKNYFINIYV